MQRRANEARRKAGVLAECLTAWKKDDDGIDGQIGAFIVAEAVLAVLRRQ